MIDRPATSTNADPLVSRLDAWGMEERSQLLEPSPRFLRQVGAARARRHLHLAAGVLAAAAAIVLAISLIPLSRGSRPRPNPIATREAPRGPVTAWLGHSAELSGLLESLPQPAAPVMTPALPPRAGDSYCAGCLEELTRI